MRSRGPLRPSASDVRSGLEWSAGEKAPRRSLAIALHLPAPWGLGRARQQRRLGASPKHPASRPAAGADDRPAIRAGRRRWDGELPPQPVFEHHPREAQMTPHAQTRQMPQPRRIPNPRHPHVQQRRRPYAVEQRLIQRHGRILAAHARTVSPRTPTPLRRTGLSSPRSLARSCHQLAPLVVGKKDAVPPSELTPAGRTPSMTASAFKPKNLGAPPRSQQRAIPALRVVSVGDHL